MPTIRRKNTDAANLKLTLTRYGLSLEQYQHLVRRFPGRCECCHGWTSETRCFNRTGDYRIRGLICRECHNKLSTGKAFTFEEAPRLHCWQHYDWDTHAIVPAHAPTRRNRQRDTYVGGEWATLPL